MQKTFPVLGLTLVLALASATEIRADVIDASANGFTTTTTAEVAAPPARVFEAVVAQVGLWWAASHTWSGTPKNMSIEGKAGGCFCERLAGGGSVRHMTVLLAEPGKTLRMSGGLGPLQEMPVTGVLTLTFAPTTGGTRVEMIYAVGGYTKDGLSKLAPLVDSVLAEQVKRLKAFVETGKL
jgi:uncharacterized protein YndB with AHSA1/START domain